MILSAKVEPAFHVLVGPEFVGRFRFGRLLRDIILQFVLIDRDLANALVICAVSVLAEELFVVRCADEHALAVAV